LEVFVDCFASGYRSEQPAHSARAFQGREKVRENWTGVFAGVPDFHAELLTSVTTDEAVEIGEWRWSGTHIDGTSFEMRGVIVLGIEEQAVQDIASTAKILYTKKKGEKTVLNLAAERSRGIFVRWDTVKATVTVR
jgi:hypothetical protein